MHVRFATGSVNGLEGVMTRTLEDGLPLDEAERAVAATGGARDDPTGAEPGAVRTLHGGDQRRPPAEAVAALRDLNPGRASTTASRVSSTGTATPRSRCATARGGAAGRTRR